MKIALHVKRSHKHSYNITLLDTVHTLGPCCNKQHTQENKKQVLSRTKSISVNHIHKKLAATNLILSSNKYWVLTSN